MLISRTPRLNSRRASANRISRGTLFNLPLNEGIAQKVQLWLQPSEIFK
jgi:hypothetical protein